jgi:hypothetical protein
MDPRTSGAEWHFLKNAAGGASVELQAGCHVVLHQVFALEYPQMAFAASFGSLIDVLAERVPAKSAVLFREHRRVDHGLLSVGLKLHCLGDCERFAPLVDGLGGAGRALDRNLYKRSDARFCLVLPPVGSARIAVLLLECLGDYTQELRSYFSSAWATT